MKTIFRTICVILGLVNLPGFVRSNSDSDQSSTEEANTVFGDYWNTKSSNASSVDGFIPLPPGYSKLVIPLGNISDSLFVMIHLSVREVLDVDEKNGVLELDTELGITWIDWKIWDYWLSNKDKIYITQDEDEEVTLDSEFLNVIWKPDIYIDEMDSIKRTSILAKLITLRFLVNNPVMAGAITFKARQNMKLRCDMDFHFYPADTQTCQYTIRSYSFPEDKLFLLWNPTQSVFLDSIKDSNHDFQVSNVEPGDELQDFLINATAPCCSPQLFSALTFTIKLRRNLTYHMVQTYLPSILLILITWLCFLLPLDLVEARIGISMTTVLTLTAMFAAVREQSPEVSYTMAIDVWMVFCISMVFIALVLFTFVFWLKRKLAKLEGLDDFQINERTFKKLLSHTKRYAFLSFAVIFIVFLLLYCSWLFYSSGYIEWSPSPKYNAVSEEDGSPKLFQFVSKNFDTNNTKKRIDTRVRFRKLFDEVIEPKLAELDTKEYPEEEVEDQ